MSLCDSVPVLLFLCTAAAAGAVTAAAFAAAFITDHFGCCQYYGGSYYYYYQNIPYVHRVPHKAAVSYDTGDKIDNQCGKPGYDALPQYHCGSPFPAHLSSDGGDGCYTGSVEQ